MEYVYVIRVNKETESPPLYKIGCTRKLKQRMAVYAHYHVKPLHVILTNDCDKLERELHARYKHCKQPPRRLIGGWLFGKREHFLLSDKELAELVAITEKRY